MKKLSNKKWLIPLVVLAGIFLVFRSGVFAGNKEQNKPADNGISVKVMTIQYQDVVPSLTFTGTLEGQVSATVSAKISGRIEQVLVQEGQEVKAGDPLLRLESVELNNSVRQAGDGVRKAQASYDLALNDYNRYQALFDKGIISAQQLDNAKAKFKAAEADLSSAAASRSSAEQQSSYAVITAPVDGVVANKTATVGQVVSPGSALMTVQDLHQVYAVVNVEQKDLGRVKVGQTGKVTLDAYPGKVFEGTVEVMNPEAGSASRMFRTKLKLDNSSGELKAGMFASVELVTGGKAQVLEIPQAAVVQKQDQYFVFTLENGKAVRHPIEIGEINGSTIAVKAGLQPGSQVIITGANRLKDGDSVRVAP